MVILQMVTAFLWHVYRFLTLRPALERLGDTPFTFRLFTVGFFTLGLLGHSGVFGGYGAESFQGDRFFWTSFLILVVGLFAMYAVFSLFFVRAGRSRVLFMGIIFCSISINLASIVGQLLDLPALFGAALTPYEVVMYFVVIRAFNALPEHMKKAGFRPAQQKVSP